MSRRGLWLFAALSIIWGMPYLFIKYAVAELDPVVTVFARTLPAAVILLGWSLMRGKLRANLRFWPAALGFAIVEMVFPWWFVSSAEMQISSGLTGLLLATVPLFGVFVARLRGDRGALAPKRMLGLALGTLGVVLLVGLDSAEAHVTLLPVLMVLGAAVGYAIGPVLIARANGEADPSTFIGLAMAFVSVLYLPLVVAKWPTAMPSGLALSSLAVLGLVCTVAAFLVFFALIDEVGPMKATLVTYVNPAVAILLGVIFLAEPVTLGLLLGFPTVLAGSWLASKH